MPPSHPDTAIIPVESAGPGPEDVLNFEEFCKLYRDRSKKEILRELWGAYHIILDMETKIAATNYALQLDPTLRELEKEAECTTT